MTDSWFRHVEDDLRHATSRFHHHGDSISAGEPQAPSPAGAIVSLAAIAGDIKTAIETAEVSVRTVLDQHMPGLLALAERVENDPLIQAAEAAELPPGARQLVADFITKLAETFPQAAPAPIEAAPAEPQPAEAEQAA